MNIYCVASLSHLGEYHIRWEESIGAALQGRIELQNDDLAAVGDMFTLDTELDLGMELTHARPKAQDIGARITERLHQLKVSHPVNTAFEPRKLDDATVICGIKGLVEVDGIHHFESSSTAYDASQADPGVETGDVLVIASEGVVGISDTWPFAITVESGVLHAIKTDHWNNEALNRAGLREKVLMAVRCAAAAGFTVIPEALSLS